LKSPEQLWTGPSQRTAENDAVWMIVGSLALQRIQDLRGAQPDLLSQLAKQVLRQKQLLVARRASVEEQEERAQLKEMTLPLDWLASMSCHAAKPCYEHETTHQSHRLYSRRARDRSG
jgi:hypothetical protein